MFLKVVSRLRILAWYGQLTSANVLSASVMRYEMPPTLSSSPSLLSASASVTGSTGWFSSNDLRIALNIVLLAGMKKSSSLTSRTTS